jgi:hypothetical protein
MIWIDLPTRGVSREAQSSTVTAGRRSHSQAHVLERPAFFGQKRLVAGDNNATDRTAISIDTDVWVWVGSGHWLVQYLHASLSVRDARVAGMAKNERYASH